MLLIRKTMPILKIDDKDVNKLARLFKEDYERRGLKFTQSSIKDYLKIGVKRKNFYAIEENKELVGCVALKEGYNNLIEMKDLIAKDENQLKMLIENMIKICQEKETRKLFTICPVIYEAALGRIGFSREGILKEQFIEKEDLVIMSMKFVNKKDKQLNLKDKLEDIEVSRQASEHLRQLPFSRK